MDFMTVAPDSNLLSHELALKLSVVLGILLFVLILFKTNTQQKQRPILILGLYAGYLAFQWLLPTEFFPLSGFPARSYPESKSARYIKVIQKIEGGDELPLTAHPVLLSLSGGREKRLGSKIFDNQQACDRFAKAYSKYEFNQDPRVGHPMIREVRFESWKWDWMREPNDPDYGFLVKRIICKA